MSNFFRRSILHWLNHLRLYWPWHLRIIEANKSVFMIANHERGYWQVICFVLHFLWHFLSLPHLLLQALYSPIQLRIPVGLLLNVATAQRVLHVALLASVSLPASRIQFCIHCIRVSLWAVLKNPRDITRIKNKNVMVRKSSLLLINDKMRSFFSLAVNKVELKEMIPQIGWP